MVPATNTQSLVFIVHSRIVGANISSASWECQSGGPRNSLRSTAETEDRTYSAAGAGAAFLLARLLGAFLAAFRAAHRLRLASMMRFLPAALNFRLAFVALAAGAWPDF